MVGCHHFTSEPIQHRDKGLKRNLRVYFILETVQQVSVKLNFLPTGSYSCCYCQCNLILENVSGNYVTHHWHTEISHSIFSGIKENIRWGKNYISPISNSCS